MWQSCGSCCCPKDDLQDTSQEKQLWYAGAVEGTDTGQMSNAVPGELRTLVALPACCWPRCVVVTSVNSNLRMLKSPLFDLIFQRVGAIT
jgi:hypothetical protein